MSETKGKLLDKYFSQLVKFIKAVSVVFSKCKRTQEELQHLMLIKSQNLVGKKLQHATEWCDGIRDCLAAFHAHDRSAIDTNRVPLLANIGLRDKWDQIDQECVWEHLDRINTTVILWRESTDTSDDAFGQAQSMVANMMKTMGVQQDDNGRISMDFRSISDFVTRNISGEQMNQIAQGFGTGEGGFGALLQSGLGALTRALAEGPPLPDNTQVVDTTPADPDSESTDSD